MVEKVKKKKNENKNLTVSKLLTCIEIERDIRTFTVVIIKMCAMQCQPKLTMTQ